jgi:hypothetical protein
MTLCNYCDEVMSSFPTDDPDTEAIEVQRREAGIAVSDYYCDLECLLKAHPLAVERVYGNL